MSRYIFLYASVSHQRSLCKGVELLTSWPDLIHLWPEFLTPISSIFTFDRSFIFDPASEFLNISAPRSDNMAVFRPITDEWNPLKKKDHSKSASVCPFNSISCFTLLPSRGRMTLFRQKLTLAQVINKLGKYRRYSSIELL